MKNKDNSDQITWSILAFEDLAVRQLFELLQLRCRVFVVEQNCPYLDPDHKDPESFHVLGYNENGELAAVSRIIPPGISYPEVSIGRVVVAGNFRGMGIGHEMNRRCMMFIRERYGDVAVRLSAQQHLSDFYQTHGFRIVSAPYDEDGIPHVEMLYLPEQQD